MATKKIQILDSLIKQAENADTLDGKHASEFALASDVESLQSKVDNMQESAYDDTEIRNLVSTNASDIDALEGLVGDTGVATQIDNAIDALNLEKTYASKSHGHEIADVDGLSDALAGKQSVGDYATNTELEEFSTNVAYINETDNQNIETEKVEAIITTIDSILSETSTNPVQNKVVTRELNQLSEEIADVKETLVDEVSNNLIKSVSVNLFDLDNVAVDTALTSTGQTYNTTNLSTSDFIDVGASQDVYIVPALFVCEYDALENFIDGTYVVNSSYETLNFTTTENTKYIRITILTSQLSFTMCKRGAEETLRRYPYSAKARIFGKNGEEVFCDRAIKERYSIKPIGNQILDTDIFYKDTNITNNGSTIYQIGYVTTDFIDVDDAEKVFVSDVRCIHQYDEYKEPIINSYTDFTAQTKNVITLHENTKYIRISRYGTSFENVMVSRGDVELPYEHIKYGLFVDDKLVCDLSKIELDPVEIDNKDIDRTNVDFRKRNIISNFEVEGWGGVYDTVVVKDTEHVVRGTESIKTSSTNEVSATIKLPVENLNLSNKVIYFNFYIENVSNLAMLQLFFGTVNITDYYGWYPSVTTMKNGWNTFTVNTESFQKKNSSTDTNLLEKVSEIRIMQKSKASVSSVVTYDSMCYADNSLNRGKIILAFDDQWDGVWKYARPAMDKYGYRGVIYAIKDLVDTPQFMTLEQLKICYENGWDIGTHGQLDLTTLTTAEAIETELLKNKNYLLENGFIRSADHYATHAGKYNDLSLSIIKRLFKTHRGTKFGYNTLPNVRKYELLNVGGNQSELSYLKAVADNTENSKCLTMINWHQIVDTPTGNETMIPALKSTFEEFMAYLATKRVDVVTLSDIYNPLY
jgi:peptidoglycan/xylan/chitin deacetylase (PgdA/CDA1 family)